MDKLEFWDERCTISSGFCLSSRRVIGQKCTQKKSSVFWTKIVRPASRIRRVFVASTFWIFHRFQMENIKTRRIVVRLLQRRIARIRGNAEQFTVFLHDLYCCLSIFHWSCRLKVSFSAICNLLILHFKWLLFDVSIICRVYSTLCCC